MSADDFSWQDATPEQRMIHANSEPAGVIFDSGGLDDVAEAFILFGRAYAERPEWSRWRVEKAILEGHSIRRGEGLLTLIEKLIELSRLQKDRGRLRSAMLLFLAAKSLSTKAKEML